MKDLAEQIAARLLDDLASEERDALDRRIAADPRVGAESESFTAMNQILGDHHAAAAPSPAFEQSMVDGFRRRAGRRASFRWMRLPAVFLPAAAAFLLTLVAIGSSITGERPWISGRFAPVLGGEAFDKRAEKAKESYGYLDELRALSSELAEQGISGRGSARNVPSSSSPSAEPRDESDAESGETLFANEATGKDIESLGALPGSGARRAAAEAAPDGPSRKLIRNASVDLEVPRFDAAAQSVAELAEAAGGRLATQNSSRQANGKMSGVLVVKVPPPSLDGFLRQIRALGDVLGQTFGTQDVTKAYFDTGARLKNARVMEQRLVELLRGTKGKVSDLLQVERELGRVREQIEQMQGELKLWDSLASFATVSVQLFEKDMDEAAAYRLRERASLSLAAPDVEAAFDAARKLADGDAVQVVQSDVTRDGSGNATAVLSLLLAPGSCDAMIERLKALGSVLDFQRTSERVASGGRGDSPSAKVERDPVQLALTIRSQDRAPSERAQLRLESGSVEAAVVALREFAAKHAVEIAESSFTRQPDSSRSAFLRFLLPRSGSDALLARIAEEGEVKDLAVQRNDAPQAGAVEPRAEISLAIAEPPRLVAGENGIAATLRRTFGQAVAALMWSVRMAGVALAFLAPWAAGIVLLVFAWKLARRRSGRGPK